MKRYGLAVALVLGACGSHDATAPAPATPAPAPPTTASAPVDASVIATPPAPVTTAPPATTTPPDRPPTDSIMPKEPDQGDTTLTNDQVARKIQANYLHGLQRCYSDRLKQDPHAAGRVVLTFTVKEDGGVTNASATGIDDMLDACFVRNMQTWRFDRPKDKDGKPTQATFSIPLVFVST
jgi:TonB family protein